MASAAHGGNIDIGRVLQRGFSTIGANLPGFLLVSLILGGVPTFAASYALMNSMAAPDDIFDASIWRTWGALLIVAMFTGYLLQAAIVRSVILDLSGQRADLTGSLVTALMLILPMIGLTIVSSIAIGFGLLLLVVPGIILYVMWIVAVPVLVEERLGVLGSLSRSAELTKGSRWQIFGLVVLLFIFSAVVSSVAGLLDIGDPAGNALLYAALDALSAAITGLLAAAMLASLYVELRTVKEGASTDSLAAIFE